MPGHFECLDELGNVILSEKDLVAKDFGIVITTSNQAGFLDDARFSSGTPYGFVILLSMNNAFDRRMPTVSFSGNRMSWTAATNTATIMYGIN